MAVAAIASGGATMAPSASATGHGIPGLSTRATAATVSADAITRPTASELGYGPWSHRPPAIEPVH